MIITYKKFQKGPAPILISNKGESPLFKLRTAIFDQLGAKVFHFHLDDINPKTWKEHTLIGTGVIDFPRMMQKFNCMNYKGLLVLAIGVPDIRKSLAGYKHRLGRFLSEG